MSNYKICTKCNVEKELTTKNFFKQKYGRGGFESQCKSCVKVRREKRYSPVIYMITNNINNHIYIGQTIKPITERFSHHINRAKGDYNTPLYTDIKTFGKTAFTISVIEKVSDRNKLNEREIFWIKHYRDIDEAIVYNLDSGGNKNKLTEKSTKVKQSRAKGLIDEVALYDWVSDEFLGLFETIVDVGNKMNTIINGVQREINNDGYCVRNKFVIIYKNNIDNIDRIISDIRETYHITSNGFLSKNDSSSRFSGSNNAMSKIDEDTAKNIILDLINGERNKTLMEKYGLSAGLISSINVRKTWKHITIDGYENVKVYNPRKQK